MGSCVVLGQVTQWLLMLEINKEALQEFREYRSTSLNGLVKFVLW
jgi:hypothetical protein